MLMLILCRDSAARLSSTVDITSKWRLTCSPSGALPPSPKSLASPFFAIKQGWERRWSTSYYDETSRVLTLVS